MPYGHGDLSTDFVPRSQSEEIVLLLHLSYGHTGQREQCWLLLDFIHNCVFRKTLTMSSRTSVSVCSIRRPCLQTCMQYAIVLYYFEANPDLGFCIKSYFYTLHPCVLLSDVPPVDLNLIADWRNRVTGVSCLDVAPRGSCHWSTWHGRELGTPSFWKRRQLDVERLAFLNSDVRVEFVTGAYALFSPSKP